MNRPVWLAIVALVSLLRTFSATSWVRPTASTNPPIWGISGGLQFAVAPGGFRAGEPRGLIRLGYPIDSSGTYDLINFIAIEPVVGGKKGFSELERSRADRLPGKQIDVDVPKEERSFEKSLCAGKLTPLPGGGERLDIPLRIEPFDNGAHVRLVLSQSSLAPDELMLTVFAEPDSALMDYCILTATMGNLVRTRELWLRDKVVHSLSLYPDYRDKDFAPHTRFPLNQLNRSSDGSVWAAITGNEAEPSAVYPFPGSKLWHYAGPRLTQYWKKTPGTFREDLHVTVNARFTYWRSQTPIPGGIAFENFEMRERFYDGQQFTYGITRQTPFQLGVTSRP